MLRIIAGKYKNRKLYIPQGQNTRPTSEKLRGALFNKVQTEIEGARFLDLFAGSGAMGFEALSRGASDVCCVERERYAINCIRKNQELLGVGKEMTLISTDVFKAIARLQDQKQRFDLIYIDPPYAKQEQEIFISHEVLRAIDRDPLMHLGGTLFIEESCDAALEKLALNQLVLVDQKTFGRSYLYTWRKKEEVSDA